MQTPANVLDLATLYLRIYFLGMPATMVYNFGAALLRAEGDTRRPLYFLTLAGVVNIILNLFFVIIMKLDVAGVAIATVISQCISAALVVRCMVKDTGPLHLNLRKLHIYRDSLGQILRIGLPAGFQGILFSLSNVVIQSSVIPSGRSSWPATPPPPTSSSSCMWP
jgi:Na+-driven multidrug efflux pump